MGGKTYAMQPNTHSHTGMIMVMLAKKATAVVRDVKNMACALRRNAYDILGITKKKRANDT